MVVIRWAMAKRNADKRYKLKLSGHTAHRGINEIAASMSPEDAGEFRRSAADVVDAA